MTTDKEALDNKMMAKFSDNHLVKQFVELGKELLDRTDRPNIITLAQFEPFVPMFNIDKKRYDVNVDRAYVNFIHDLYRRWIEDLGINRYEVTYVIYSEEDRRIAVNLDREFSRINPDNLSKDNHRGNVPVNIPRDSIETIKLDAAKMDVMSANNTPEQNQFFARLKMESAVTQRHFVEENLTPKLRDIVTGKTDEPTYSDDVIETLPDDDD